MWRAYWISQAVSLGIGTLIALWYLSDPGSRNLWPIGPIILGVLPPLIFLSLFVNVFVHELGHYLAARSLGFNVIEFKVLDFSLIGSKTPRAAGDRRLGWVQAETTLDQERPGAWRIFIAAGPLAGITLLIFCYFGLASGSGPLVIAGLLGGLIAFPVNLGSLDYRRRALPRTDLEKFIDVGRSDSKIFAILSFRRLLPIASTENAANFPLEDILRSRYISEPPQRVLVGCLWTMSAIAHRSGTAAACQFYREVCRAAGSEDGEYARSEALAAFTQDAILESSFCAAVFDRDQASAKQYLSHLDSHHRHIWPTARRAYAAITWLSGNSAEAQIQIDRARAILDQVDDPDAIAASKNELRFLELLENIISNRI